MLARPLVWPLVLVTVYMLSGSTSSSNEDEDEEPFVVLRLVRSASFTNMSVGLVRHTASVVWAASVPASVRRRVWFAVDAALLALLSPQWWQDACAVSTWGRAYKGNIYKGGRRFTREGDGLQGRDYKGTWQFSREGGDLQG